MTACDLSQKKCVPCEGGVPALTAAEIKPLLQQLNDWQINADHTEIVKRFEFKGFNKVMSFVNAVAWIANQESHHPDIKLGYNYCEILYTTHAVNGLTDNDFICAAKVDQLLF